MEDLWRMQDMGYRTGDCADRAEYNKMLKRFRDEEECNNRFNLLFRGDRMIRREEK